MKKGNTKKGVRKNKKIDITEDMPILSTDDLEGTWEEIEEDEKVKDEERIKRDIEKAKKS